MAVIGYWFAISVGVLVSGIGVRFAAYSTAGEALIWIGGTASVATACMWLWRKVRGENGQPISTKAVPAPPTQTVGAEFRGDNIEVADVTSRGFEIGLKVSGSGQRFGTVRVSGPPVGSPRTGSSTAIMGVLPDSPTPENR